MNRRDFLSLMAAAPVLGQAAFAAAQDRPLRHAVVGCGGQGRRHARVFANTRDCQLVAFAELDPARREQTLKELGDKAEGVTAYEDFRELLQNPEIDSVSVATPDHWHTPVALLALQAGKHVYVEKPCCHVPLEGQRLVDAAKASGKCVQHGTQSRSGEGIKKAIGMLRDGAIGKVRLAKAINHQLREPIGRAPESDPPPGVNYDLWLGPAPKHAFTQNRWHYNWHWFWDYGGGDFVNDGVHQVDVARWGLGVAYPKLVTGSGGQLFYDDDHQTPDTQLITFEYPDVYLVYEMRLWTEYPMEGITNGVIFYGDNGIMTIEGEGCYLLLKGQKR
ncbi:MAG: Gfo/Idh/MocA family oxidoreductase, partial [Candidatus Hydrogenedentes bacterium]|nr:Gfo/Idh/MocA family oxidoreductase [Candidatus Hydrogenedentota bacterium]